jgi:pyrrolysine biosynthesis protein PylD
LTRLTEKDITGLDQELVSYNRDLLKKTGMTLREIACFASGVREEEFIQAGEKLKVAVVPITAGLGVIGGFVHSVQSITRFLGFETVITRRTDVDGFYEATEKKADIVFMADDNRFIAVNLHRGFVADNGVATGRGYVAALYGMSAGLEDQKVLVLGAGPVGRAALKFLQELGARSAVFDINSSATADLANQDGITVEHHIDQALIRYPYLVDATPQGSFLTLEKLHKNIMVSAPGVPLGLTTDTYTMIEERVIHDPLQIGVAVMLALVSKN